MIKLENNKSLRKALHNSLDLLFEKLEQQDKELETLEKERVILYQNQNNDL